LAHLLIAAACFGGDDQPGKRIKHLQVQPLLRHSTPLLKSGAVIDPKAGQKVAAIENDSLAQASLTRNTIGQTGVGMGGTGRQQLGKGGHIYRTRGMRVKPDCLTGG